MDNDEKFYFYLCVFINYQILVFEMVLGYGSLLFEVPLLYNLSIFTRSEPVLLFLYQVIFLIGNKSDLEAQRDVTYEEAKQFAEENGKLMFV